MPDQDINRSVQIDRATSTTICQVIGDRLRQNLAAEPTGLPAELQHLLDELRLQDVQNRP
jgi:hypothetical protein